MTYESDYYAYNPYNPSTTLKQHGILGMKWGVWNAETRARYLGTNKRKASKSDEVPSNRKPKNISGRKIGSKLGLEKNKYVNPFGMVNKDAFLKDLQSDKEFNSNINKEQTKILQSMLKDNNYGAFLYGELNRVTNNKIKNQLYSYTDDAKKVDSITRRALDAIINNEFGNSTFTPKEYDVIWDHVSMLAKYSDACDKVFDEEIEKVGFSDSNAWIVKNFMRKAYVEPLWNLTVPRDSNTEHSDSSNFYIATDPYDPKTTAKQHGILGMKWGVWNEETRARYMGSGSKSKWFSKITDRFNKPKEEPHLKRTHLTKELAEISDAELNAAIKRMQLEQTYLQMLKNYPTASDRGEKYANQFSDNLFNQLTTGLGGAIGKRIAKAIDDWINDDSRDKDEYAKEAKNMSDEELKKRNARDALENQYIKNRSNDKK